MSRASARLDSLTHLQKLQQHYHSGVNMKKIRALESIWPVLAISLCLIQPAIATEDANIACSNSTLKGTYMLNVSGVNYANGAYVPASSAAFVSYDGLGNITLKKTGLIDGSWVTNVSKGSYVIETDCTGIAIYPNSAQFSYYVAPDGSSLSFVKIANFKNGKPIASRDSYSGNAARVSKHQAKFIE